MATNMEVSSIGSDGFSAPFDSRDAENLVLSDGAGDEVASSDGTGDDSELRSSELGLRGLSVEFLRTAFLDKARDAGLDPATASFTEVEAAVFNPESAHRVCPRDGLSGCAYVDAVWQHEDEARGENTGAGEPSCLSVRRATHMLSYTWAYTLAPTVGSLEAFCARSHFCPPLMFIWLCCACVNQHRVRAELRAGKAVSTKDFLEMFGSRVAAIGNVLALFAPLRKPLYTKRVWCVFELHLASLLAARNQCTFHILLAPGDLVAFQKSIPEGKATIAIRETTASIDIETTQATVQADRDYILGLIREEGLGLPGFNEMVRADLQTLLTNEAERLLLEQYAGAPWTEAAASSWRHVVRLLRRNHLDDRALSLGSKGMKLQQVAIASGSYFPLQAGMELVMECGILEFFTGMEGCHQTLENALQACLGADLGGTNTEANLLNVLACADKQRSLFETQPRTRAAWRRSATRKLARCLLLMSKFRETNGFDACSIHIQRNASVNLGRVRTLELQERVRAGGQVLSEDFRKVNRHFENALELHRSKVEVEDLLPVSLCLGWGKLKLLEHDWAGAELWLSEGRKVGHLGHALHCPEHADMMTRLAEAQARRGKLDEALNSYVEALAIWDSLACQRCQTQAVEQSYRQQGSAPASASLLQEASFNLCPKAAEVERFERILRLRENLLCRRCLWISTRWC
ncbi:unnamed protein product [Polarella glacialis]|uniref:Uncharacterized protein n=1 Tax=Polarella glacialis TaxID=89957 RepID=A0A813KZG7_POLGL|nr:unnamed protein product [Polarella glacialis]